MIKPLFADAPPARVLVTGADGMLGRAFAAQIAACLPHWDVRALGKAELDVCDPAQLVTHAEWLAGGWIVHCAGLVDVEGCARDPERARAVIVDGTAHVLALAERAGARILYPQSFLVYDGQTNPIPETETPRPLSLYGQLKLEAQRLVEAASDRHLVVCMAGFFGGEARDKNFVGRFIPNVLRLIESGTRDYAVGDRVWQPTWTEDLARNSLLLMARDKAGFYQMACHGAASFYELACAVVDELGFSDVLHITPVAATTVTGNELGRRPDQAILSCQRLRDEGLDLQQDWRAALHSYLSAPYFQSLCQKVKSDVLSRS